MVRLFVADKLLFLFLLLIPTQLGKHFWPEWSLINGIRSDYLSPVLYLTDVVWIMWLISEITNHKLQITGKFQYTNYKSQILQIGVIAAIIGLNIFLAENSWAAGYRWIRIGQLIVTVWMLRKKDRAMPYPYIKYMTIIIPIWIMGESLLGLAQVAKNGSLQGIFWWLGERKFDYMTLGAALMSWWGELRVRAYGTFSHPNSMGGFLLVALLIWEKIRKGDHKSRPYIYRIGTWIVRIVGIMGVILTGSRLVWGVGGLVLIFRYLDIEIFRGKIKIGLNKLSLYGILILGIISWVVIKNSSGWDMESWSKRVSLVRASGEMIKANPLFGIGAGNFVAELPSYLKGGILWLQPVHNILLLGMSEIGVIGIAVVGWMILKISDLRSQISVKRFWDENWIIIGVILITGMGDHYWLTLPQNMWLLAIVAAII